MMVSTEQHIPTYLREYLQEDIKCLLVHKKVKVSLKCSSGDSEISFNTTEGDLDLTGNPLQVDLNDSVAVFQTGIQQVLPNWTIAESAHFPLGIADARCFLNNNCSGKKSNLPVFCVTDGKDKENTIIIGSQYNKDFTTYLVKILGLYAANDTRLSLENLSKLHDEYVRFKADSVHYNFKRIYNIHGFNFHEIPNLENSTCNGCMFLQTCWKTEEKEEPGEIQLKIILKVISGHNQSSIRFLFNQLKNLEKLMQIKANAHDGNTLISDDFLTISELTNEIQSLCMNNMKMKKNRPSNILDLNDLREETILDKLWYLLIRCHNLEDLKNILCVFFTIVKREYFNNNDNVLDSIANECLRVPEYMSKITYTDSLNLLLYIGCEKLKRDYFTLSYFYYPIRQAELERKWSEFKSLDYQISRGITKINDTDNEKKMDFLKDLHRISEILIFSKRDVKNCFELSSENFNIISEHIFEKYIFNKLHNNYENVELLEISCDLDSKNDTLYKSKSPVTSIFEYVSTIGRSNIKTIFHISQNQIFPKCIFDDYENAEIDDQVYASVFVELNHSL